jgi:hypothetical protein
VKFKEYVLNKISFENKQEENYEDLKRKEKKILFQILAKVLVFLCVRAFPFHK